jgi:hypothetical protein
MRITYYSCHDVVAAIQISNDYLAKALADRSNGLVFDD